MAAPRAEPRFEYLALAQQKPPKSRKDRFSDDAFLPIPEPLPPLRPQGATPPSNAGGAPNPNAGTSGTAANRAGEVDAPNAAGEGASVASPFIIEGASGSGRSAASILGPGRAQAVAQPLRQALARAGYGNAAIVAPGSEGLASAIEANRLSLRVLEAARASLAELAALPESGAAQGGENSNAIVAPAAPSEGGAATGDRWARLYQAAARVGQATGHRAVVVLGVVPRAGAAGAAGSAGAPASGGAKSGKSGATVAMAVVDALRESGEPIVFDEEGETPAQANESAAVTAAALVARSLNVLPVVTTADKVARVSGYMARAREAHAAGDWAGAADYLAQVLAFEPGRADARLLLAESLSRFDADAAARAYRSTMSLEGVDGPTWAKVAVAFTVGTSPEWPRALEAARKALALGFESSELRQAMATAQLGRAALFREARRFEKADEAEADARQHLDRALALAPDDPGALRLMVRFFTDAGRYREAIRLLDRLALQYPEDVELQTSYATSLMATGARDEDAFVAWAKVWQLSGQAAVPLDAIRYRRLSEGFDQRLATLGKRAAQLASGVAAGTSARETSLLQMTRYKEDMEAAIAAIRVMQPSFDVGAGDAHASRVLAADLMSQAMTSYATYLETGQELLRERATALHRQGLTLLNAARTARG